MKIEIYPLDKIVIDGTSIEIGMNKKNVERLIGVSYEEDNKCYYYDNDMVIHYNANKEVEFIEFLGGIDGKLHPTIYGVSAFGILADKLVEILKQNNNGEIDDSENGHSLFFLNISIGVYREITPLDVMELLQEFEEKDINNIKYMKDIANHWQVIGVGRKGYYLNWIWISNMYTVYVSYSLISS